MKFACNDLDRSIDYNASKFNPTNISAGKNQIASNLKAPFRIQYNACCSPHTAENSFLASSKLDVITKAEGWGMPIMCFCSGQRKCQITQGFQAADIHISAYCRHIKRGCLLDLGIATVKRPLYYCGIEMKCASCSKLRRGRRILFLAVMQHHVLVALQIAKINTTTTDGAKKIDAATDDHFATSDMAVDNGCAGGIGIGRPPKCFNHIGSSCFFLSAGGNFEISPDFRI